MIKLRLDLDDVLNNFSQHWMEKHYEVTGERLDPTHWHMHEISEHGEKIYDHFTSKDFFYNAPVKMGAGKTIRFLESNSFFFDYEIVSSCQQEDDSDREYIYQQKLQWLKENLNFTAFENFHLVGKDKTKHVADIYVDDNLGNLVDHGSNDSLKLLFSAPHNKDINPRKVSEDTGNNIMRVRSHSDLLGVLRGIMAEQTVKNYIDNTNSLFYLSD